MTARPMLWEYDRLAWNMQAGRPPATVERQLRALIVDAAKVCGHVPHIVVLSEARPYGPQIRRVARELGYAVVQSPPQQLSARQRRKRLQEEDANLAVLVRLDVGVVSARRWRMRRRWVGPVNEWPHLPRVYWQLVLAIPGAGLWRDSPQHWPTPRPDSNALAVQESARKTGRYLRSADTTPSVAGGDLNAGAARLRQLVPGVLVVAGHGPDNVLTNDVVVSTAEALGKYGSNHQAVLTRHRNAA